ncbi:uncharacterized protein LOC125232714 [Leguminivora glycinivorella]|uniref:uncharacterized protein LOC125232714 n=1 Tax=Leguminivora glycinivorella TaxID=1035111 RepID=UPI00200FFA4C|nr:uncharacterized protein LOC125232714 [Leguminivora glycinivorella]
MIQTVITIMTIWSWTQAHVLNDSDHCSLAQSCQHDGSEARGVDDDGRTVRLFLDACDLHEYNCDHGTNFELITVTSPCTEDEVSEATESVTEETEAVHLLDSEQWTPEADDYHAKHDENNVDEEDANDVQKYSSNNI